jgi:hypothetical protein
MLGAKEDRREAGFLGVPGPISPRSDELDDFLPRTSDGAGDGARCWSFGAAIEEKETTACALLEVEVRAAQATGRAGYLCWCEVKGASQSVRASLVHCWHAVEALAASCLFHHQTTTTAVGSASLRGLSASRRVLVKYVDVLVGCFSCQDI